MEFEESPLVDPENIIVGLLDVAQNSLWMSTTLHAEFYNRPRVRTALLGALDRVEDARLLLDSKALSWETIVDDFPWLFNNQEISNKINVRKSKIPILHWLIVDGIHFRLEKPHNGTVETSNMQIRNADKPTRDMLQNRFLTWWNNAGSPR